ncbi:MAG: nitrogen fixation protein NifH [Spirochaetales bacterium]|nr:nitrogen fixation protein NifH [Spirochaetales bacterium]
MTGWKSVLKADPIDWLLEPDNPSVRYFTLLDLMDESPESNNVKKARRGILSEGPVPVILSGRVNGLWGDPDRYYLDKYCGTSWQLLILAELGIDNANGEVKTACEHILQHAQDRESHGFAVHRGGKGGGRHSEVIPCLTGNMTWAFIRLGYRDDARIKKAVKWITAYQRFDDNTGNPPSGWPYDRLEVCWGKHTCHMAAAKALKALSALPPNQVNKDVKTTIKNGVEYFLKHRVFRKSHDLSKVSRPGWLKFGFPLMYQTDALEIADILTSFGCRDERLQETIDLIISKQDSLGRWKLENTFNGKWIADIEEKGKPGKWITLRALRTLKRYFSE